MICCDLHDEEVLQNNKTVCYKSYYNIFIEFIERCDNTKQDVILS